MITPHLWEIAQFHLRSQRIHLTTSVPAVFMRRAAATNGLGIDHLAAEDFLALVDGSPERNGAFAMVLTDRRLFVRDEIDAQTFEVPYLPITGAQTQSKSAVFTWLRLLSGAQSIAVPPCGQVKPLVEFFSALARLPPEARVCASPPPVLRGHADPTGASSAVLRLEQPEPRAALLLRAIYEAHRAGAIPADAGFDLAQRAWLLGRTLRYGRGSSQGFWLSALAPADLVRVLAGFFGAPTAQTQNGPDLVLDFVIRAGGSNAGAVASSAVGLAMLAVVGVGWVSVPRQTVQSIRVVVRSMGPGIAASGFAVLGAKSPGRYEPLGFVEADMFVKIDEDLLNLEALVLLLRGAFGWNAPVEALLGQPRAALESRVNALLGPTDLWGFYAGMTR